MSTCISVAIQANSFHNDMVDNMVWWIITRGGITNIHCTMMLCIVVVLKYLHTSILYKVLHCNSR